MTGPDGEKARGWWQVLALDEPRLLKFEDGFADESGTPDPRVAVIAGTGRAGEIATGTRMTITSSFADAEHLQELVTMVMVEGMTAAMGQIDGLLGQVPAA